jgi:phage gpG-like protein
MMLTIEVSGDKELIARLQSMPQRMRAALYAKTTELALELESHVKKDKLQGQVLNHRTGRLQQSIHHDVQQSGSSITGRVYSAGPVPYAGIHEFGGSVPDRYPVNAKALHFFIGGKEVFATFARGFTMPERSYLRSSLADYRDRIIDGLTQAVQGAVKE